MENKSSLKLYLLGAVVLIVIIGAVVFWPKNQESGSMGPHLSGFGSDPVAKNPIPTANDPVPTANIPIPAVTAVTAETATSSAPAVNSAPTNGLIGTWASAVSGKGLQGSGKATLNGISYELNLAGNVNLVIQKVENNTASGTITFSNACITGTKSVDGKAATAFSPQCEKTFSRPALMQIDGNKITYSGKSDLGADISLTGTFTGDTMTGNFIRKSSSGDITGTLNLVRTKK